MLIVSQREVEYAHRDHGGPWDPNKAGTGNKWMDPNDFVGVFFLSTTTMQNPASKAWVVGHTGQTKAYAQKRSEPTSGLLLSSNSDLVLKRNDKKKQQVPKSTKTRSYSFPMETAPATSTRYVPAHIVTAKPVWKRNENLPKEAPKPRGVHFLRGRAVSANEVKEAQKLVEAARKENQESNARILAHPRVNHKDLEDKDEVQLGSIDKSVPEPTKDDYKPINETIREAAALVAEYEARNGLMEYTWPLSGNHSLSNSTLGRKRQAAATSYWYANISPKGKSPFHPKGAAYVVYKNAILDCGAKGDGVTDDTKAIQACIAAQDRCGGDSLTCASTSVMPLVIYFPPGNYLVSSNIEIYFQTNLIGDPIDRPRIIAAKSFQGLGVLSSDFYIPGGGGKGWYINQSNFFRQLRNFIIGMSLFFPLGCCQSRHCLLAVGQFP